MQQAARLWFSAIVFAALCWPALAAERIEAEPIFYQAYNVSTCTAVASGIGEVTATYFYYWDIAAKENVVAYIEHVSYELAPGYFGDVYKGRTSIIVKIFGSPGVLYASKACIV